MDRRDWFEKVVALVAGGATCIAVPRKMPKTTFAPQYLVNFYNGGVISLDEYLKLHKRLDHRG